MRYLRTESCDMLSALRSIAGPLDECWWSVGCGGFQFTDDFVERLTPRLKSVHKVYYHWMRLLDDYVDHNTPVDRVGKPGFFTRLGDSVDFCWAVYFAVEGRDMPLKSLEVVENADAGWFEPYEGLPPDVVLVARDIDGAYQEYGFRDEWMLETVRVDLLARGLRAEEVTSWHF